MESHFDLSDETFERFFEQTTLDPKLFDHVAHLRLAWIHIKNYGIDPAVKNVTSQLRNYTEVLGAADKYHETVTVAAVKAVYHFILKSESDNFRDFMLEFPRLKFDFKELLAQHYTGNIFSNEAARSSFLLPDLLPFE